MLPEPKDSAILAAVASHLGKLSEQRETHGPATRFSLRMASALTAMVGRESERGERDRIAHLGRLKARYPEADDPEATLMEEIREGELSEQDWTQLLQLLRQDLSDQLGVIAPHFDTRMEVEQS